MSSTWGSSWGTSWGSSWDVAVVVAEPAGAFVPLVNGRERRPGGIVGIEHYHLSHARGTDPINVGDVSTSGFLGSHRDNVGNREASVLQRGGGLTGFLRSHVSMRGTDPVNVGGSMSGVLGQHRQNTGHRIGTRRQGASLTGTLRKHRHSHYYPGLTEVPVPPATGGGGDWILATSFWDDDGIWDDTSMWNDAV